MFKFVREEGHTKKSLILLSRNVDNNHRDWDLDSKGAGHSSTLDQGGQSHERMGICN